MKSDTTYTASYRPSRRPRGAAEVHVNAAMNPCTYFLSPSPLELQGQDVVAQQTDKVPCLLLNALLGKGVQICNSWIIIISDDFELLLAFFLSRRLVFDIFSAVERKIWQQGMAIPFPFDARDRQTDRQTDGRTDGMTKGSECVGWG